MVKFRAITEEELVRGRDDPAFRQQLLVHALEQLLAVMHALQRSRPTMDALLARQLREGAELAVKLADMINGLEARKGKARVA
jgi:hypothetical protein